MPDSNLHSVLYVWDADYPWDVRTEKTCLSLTEAGYDVHIVARNRRWSSDVESLPEGTVHRMHPWRAVGRGVDGLLGFPAYFSPRWRSLISETAATVRPRVVIARDLPLCPTAAGVAHSLRIPLILDMAENYPAMMRAIWETGRNRPIDSLVRNPRVVARIERKCLVESDHIIVVVEESAERLYDLGVDPGKITVVSNTPPLARAEMFEAPAKHSGPALRVVYMGNLEVARGLLESIEGIGIARTRGFNAQLLLIGRGRDEALLRARAAGLGLGSEAVQFLGYIESHAEALAIVGACDIGLLPHQKCEAWDTTIPNKLFDYMAAGIPVLSSDAAPCKRILGETGAGLTFASGSADEIANGIGTLADISLRRLQGEAGRRAILGRFNWEYDSAVLVGVVNRLAGESETSGLEKLVT